MENKNNKEDLEKKYSGNTDDKLFLYHRRNHPVYYNRIEGIKEPFISIFDGEKLRLLQNKKDMVNRIFNDVEYEEQFKHLETSVIRRTIKKYIDYISS